MNINTSIDLTAASSSDDDEMLMEDSHFILALDTSIPVKTMTLGEKEEKFKEINKFFDYEWIRQYWLYEVKKLATTYPRRELNAAVEKMEQDPKWKDYIRIRDVQNELAVTITQQRRKIRKIERYTI